MGCCSGAKWKREVVPDHKFDFIDVREFHDGGCFTRLRYAWVYILVLKSFLTYVADLYTAIALLASNRWAGNLLEQADSSEVKIPFSIGKWIFTGCIIFSFVLLLWESRKARNIIRSRDISYSYTNVIANNYWSMKSYDHFCFFCQINSSRKKKDEFAFFVFFTFKGWKRLLLADGPRQVINALTLYSFGKAYNFTTDFSAYIEGSYITAGILITMIFTVVIWAGSFILLLIAAGMYVPLLCYIQGNLKEYCCHKVDKRIAELMKKRTRKRLLKEMELAKKEAQGDYSHLKDRNGKLKEKPMAQPTLPQIDFDDNDGYAGSIMSHKDPYYFNQSQVGAASSESGHMYPPRAPYNDWSQLGMAPPQPSYALSDGPGKRQPYGYAGSDMGYEPSIHSTDKFMPYESSIHLDQPYVPPYAPNASLSKAPSYRSQTSLNEGHGVSKRWDEAPPTPAVPDVYAAIGEHMRHQTQPSSGSRESVGAYSNNSYQAPARNRLRDNVEQQQHQNQQDGYFSSQHPDYQHQQQGRPDSVADFSDYYGHR